MVVGFRLVLFACLSLWRVAEGKNAADLFNPDGPKLSYIVEPEPYARLPRSSSTNRIELESGRCYPPWRWRGKPGIRDGDKSINGGWDWVVPPPPFDNLTLLENPQSQPPLKCDVDVLDAKDITPEEFRKRYIETETAALVRNVIDEWPALQTWHRDNIVKEYADAVLSVGHKPPLMLKRMKLKDYIDKYAEPISGSPPTPDAHADYLWDDTRPDIRRRRYDDLDADTKQDLKRRVKRGEIRADWKNWGPRYTNHDFRRDFSWPSRVIARSAWNPETHVITIGPACSGSHMHAHQAAWNVCLFGLKRWMFHSPQNMTRGRSKDLVYSDNLHILDWFHFYYPDLYEKSKPQLKECYQSAGDLMYVPENYYHGVLNVHTSLAVSSQTDYYAFSTEGEDEGIGDIEKTQRAGGSSRTQRSRRAGSEADRASGGRGGRYRGRERQRYQQSSSRRGDAREGGRARSRQQRGKEDQRRRPQQGSRGERSRQAGERGRSRSRGGDRGQARGRRRKDRDEL